MIEEFSFNEIKQKFHHVELKDQLESAWNFNTIGFPNFNVVFH